MQERVFQAAGWPGWLSKFSPSSVLTWAFHPPLKALPRGPASKVRVIGGGVLETRAWRGWRQVNGGWYSHGQNTHRDALSGSEDRCRG